MYKLLHTQQSLIHKYTQSLQDPKHAVAVTVSHRVTWRCARGRCTVWCCGRSRNCCGVGGAVVTLHGIVVAVVALRVVVVPVIAPRVVSRSRSLHRVMLRSRRLTSSHVVPQPRSSSSRPRGHVVATCNCYRTIVAVSGWAVVDPGGGGWPHVRRQGGW